MTFAAVLSDLDGVLVDSGDAVERVWRAWAVERGLDPDDVGRASHGVPGRQVIEDTPAGIAAARAAGMTVWAVTTAHIASELSADVVAADVRELLGRWRSRRPTAAG